MRRALLLTLAIAFAIACGDDITEPTTAPTTGATAVAGGPLFATTTTEDGLSISTDKDDYQPGDVVHFTGYGWQPYDVLDIVLNDDPQTHEPHTWTVSVGADGMFHDSTYVVDEGDLNVAFTLVATSRATGRSLTVNFTDSQPQAVTLTPASVTITQGGTATYPVTVTVGGNSNPCTVSLSVTTGSGQTGLPTGATSSFTNNPASTTGANITSTLTINVLGTTTPGTYTFTVQATRGSTCQGNGPVNGTGTLVVQPPADQTRPTVTINQAAGQADPTNQSPINFTVVFSEPVTGFATGDVTLSGAGSAGATATVSGSGANYTVAVSGMTTTGPVTASIAASVAEDASHNANEASTSTDNTVLYDKTGPQVTINQKSDQANLTNQSPILFTVIFDKPITGFTADDITLGGTAHPTTAVISGGSDGMNWEVAVSGMTGDGTVTADIPADVVKDAAGNGNMAASSTDNEVTYDATSPTVTINQAAGQADPTNASPINFTVVFSEPVSGFTSNDVQLGGTASPTTAVVSDIGTDKTTYKVAVSGMTGDGTVTAIVKSGSADDEAGNHSAASTSTDNSVTYDKTPPTATINQAAGQADPTSATPINFTVVFSEDVTGFAGADVTLTGGTGTITATVTGTGKNYNVAVSGITSGTVAASIGAGKTTDAAGNGNLASTSTDNSVTFDAAPPAVSNVAVDPDPTNGSIDVTATARVDDASSGNSKIVSAYYKIDNGAEVSMAAADGSFNSATEDVTASIPAATVAALSNGSHQVCVRGVDQAGNTSSYTDTGACATLTVDKQPPVVSSVTVSPSLTNGSINVTATANVDDAATGNSRITAAYYSIDGGAAVAMTASDGGFDEATENVTASIPASVVHALPEGDHEVCVRGKDLAGNFSEFADACATLSIDKTPPEVTINQAGTQGDPTKASPVNFNVVFSEDVSDFATGDVSLSGTAGATTATVTGSGTTYNVAVSGMTGDGTVIASIAADVAHDGAANGNNASTSSDHSVVFDQTPPAIACGAADGNWHADNVSIACTASDATSGLANSADASFNLTTSVAAGTETSNASTNSRDVLDLAGNKATAGPIAGNKVDKKAPEVALTCPSGLVILNGTANASWTATDGGSGVTPSGTVALVTSSIGTKTASVSVEDAVHNASTLASCSYTVGYNFAGFSAPVDRPNMMNVSKAGQAIPLKWRLTDALGRPITDLTSVAVQTVGMPCGTYTGTDVIEEYAAGSSGLQNLGDGYYQFNWKTPVGYAGTCKSIALTFGSGGGYTEKPSAFFTFKK
jgi:hypothetical protein